MAAIDPTAAPEADEEGNLPAMPRSTLKIIKQADNPDSDDEEDDGALEKLLAGGDSDEDGSDEDESEEEANGGPSDPAKSKKSRREAAIKKLLAATELESDDEMEDADAQPNGKSKKGKEKASEDDEDDEEEDSDEEELDMEDYVVCTLDTERVSCPLSLLVAPANQDCRTTSNPLISPLGRARGSSSLSLEPTQSTSPATMSFPRVGTPTTSMTAKMTRIMISLLIWMGIPSSVTSWMRLTE